MVVISRTFLFLHGGYGLLEEMYEALWMQLCCMSISLFSILENGDAFYVLMKDEDCKMLRDIFA